LTNAEIDDPVRGPGSGPLAFGAIAFDDASSAQSVLIVPRLIIATNGSESWITELSSTPVEHDPQLPEPIAPGEWNGAGIVADAPDVSYSESVSRATELIAEGFAEKIVIARRVHGSFDASGDVRWPLGALASRYLDCWTFAI